MASGDSLKISVDAHGSAVAELKRVRGAMARNEKELLKLTGAGKVSEVQTKKNVRAQKDLKAAVSGTAIAAKAAIVAYAGIAAAKAFGNFVKEGELAANVARRFADALPNAEIALQSFKVATAGLMTETDIQVIANRFVRLGVSVDDTRRLLELATKASIDQQRSVQSVAKVIESSLKGRTTGLVEIGVNLDKITGLTKAYAKSTGVAVGELDEMDRRMKVALPAALKALGDQFDGVNLQDFTTDVQEAHTALEDLESDMAAFVAEGWGEAWGMLFGSSAQEDLKNSGERMVRLAALVAKISRSTELSKTGIVANLASSQKSLQAEAARYSMVLAKLPLKVKEAELAKLTATLGKQSPHIVSLIRQYAGLGKSLDSTASSAKELAKEVQNSTGAWTDWLKKVTEITAKQEEDAAKRRKAAGQAAYRALMQARAQAAEQLKGADAEAVHRAKMNASSDEAQRADEIRRFENEKHESKMLGLKAKGVELATLTGLRVAHQAKLGAKLLKATEAWNVAQAERGKAAALEAIQQGAALKLARIEVQLADAVAPLEQARLEVMKARIQASLTLRTLSDNETEAAAQRLNVQMQLNAAMSAYNAELARASSSGWVEGLDSVSAAMSGISARAGGLGEIGQGLSSVSDAVGSSSGIWAQYAEGQAGVGEAVSGTIGVLSDAAGSFIEDEQAKAAVASAFEVASSIASFATGDIAGGIAHAAAATAFAAVAAGAGGGGAAATAGGSGGASAGASGGDNQQGGFGDTGGRQVIVQFGSGVILGSAAAVGSAIKQAEYANRGTGQAAGY